MCVSFIKSDFKLEVNQKMFFYEGKTQRIVLLFGLEFQYSQINAYLLYEKIQCRYTSVAV